jgi:F-type H+-transporting ATPase subunit delta
VAQLSNRYGLALFNLSVEQNRLDSNLEAAVFLRDTLKDPKCQSVITHPRITSPEKRAFFKNVFAGHIGADLLGFLYLAVNKNREAFIVPALTKFIEMARKHRRETTALVVSAVPLREGQVSALASLLSKKLVKKVDIAQKVDSSIIGGLYIQVDGFYIDRTIKSRLQDMKNSMSE